jgi:hypothetical protein
MNKNEMAIKTVEGFIHQLEKEGLTKHASELKSILAMSRRRKDAEAALTNMTVTLLIHLIKYIALPHSRDRNKWHKEIKGYLTRFDIRNESPKKRPWLPIEFIRKDLNDVLSGSKFLSALEQELEGYPDQNKKMALSLLKINRSLKAIGVKMFYGPNNNLSIKINGQIL